MSLVKIDLPNSNSSSKILGIFNVYGKDVIDRSRLNRNFELLISYKEIILLITKVNYYTMSEVSKIYSSAQKISNLILEDFANEYSGMKTLFDELGFDKEVCFKNITSIKTSRDKLLQRLQDECLLMDYLYVAPILIEAISKFYVGKGISESTVLGLALKTTLSFVWAGSYKRASDSRSYEVLKNLISKAIFNVVLEQIIKVWEIKDLNKVVISNNGSINSDIFYETGRQIALQGRHEYKVLDQAKEIIWENEDIDDTLEGIINGTADPKSKFENCFLADVPISDISFWVELWVLRVLIRIAASSKQASQENLYGVCIIPESGILVQTAIPQHLFQEIIFDCFWRPDWHRKRIAGGADVLQRMIVERPCMRVRDSNHLFATSLILLMDSVNYCLECYIHKNDALYEKYFTKPFENKVMALLSKFGFTCGEVTVGGAWKTKDGIVRLTNKQPMPGQIDIFALDEYNKTAFLIDCKLVHFPSNHKALNNLITKFNDNDTEGFHKKLEKKAKWLEGCEQLRGIEIVSMHIANIHIPYFDSSKIVLSYEQLESLLKEVQES